MKLWHVGMEVHDLDEAIKHWKSFGYSLKILFKKDVPDADAAMMIDSSTGVGIELWQFHSDGPYNKYVARHVGFKVDNIQQTAQKLEAKGYTIRIPYTEGVQANYLFLEDPCGSYIEIAEDK